LAHNRQVVEAWIRHPALDALAAQWGRVPPDATPERLAFYRVVADELWDFRKGKERNQVVGADLTTDQVSLIEDASEVLGLRTATCPARQTYDSVLILGGLLRGCLTRTRAAHELITGGLIAHSVVGLGGTRVLTEPEVDQGERLGIRATTEYQAMLGAVVSVFAPDGNPSVTSHEDEQPNAAWAITDFPGEPRLAVVSAPSLEPEKRRANTSDTLIWWTARESGAGGANYLLITHPIYVPYQAATAVRTYGLPNNAGVELTGVTATAGDLGRLTQEFLPHNYLQEIGSAIRGYSDLWDAMNESL
jgi:hypothetical protein